MEITYGATDRAKRLMVAEFVCGMTDLRYVGQQKLQILHDELFYLVNDRVLARRDANDLPHPMAMIFIMDYVEAITKAMENGSEYWTAVADYEGATRYHHETMWKGDFRMRQQRQDDRLGGVKIKEEEN